MIKISNLNKKLGENVVLKNLNLTINDGIIFGLIGINGAGKSTLLRILSGIYQEDSGEVLINNQKVFENLEVKKDIFFLADEPYYPSSSTIKTLKEFYKVFYKFDEALFDKYIAQFKLDNKKTINNFSKGMKRQLFISIALAIKPKYLFLDEAFDGLDPFARLVFKKEIATMVDEYKTTVIISSHSLRELEDICEEYGLLDGGCITKSGNIDESKQLYFKYQLAFNKDLNKEDFLELNVVSYNKVGKIITIVFNNEEEVIEKYLKVLNPLLIEKIPVDFEELFLIEVVNNEVF